MAKLSAYDTAIPAAADFVPILQGGENKKSTVQGIVDRSSGPGLDVEFTTDANLTLSDVQGNANALVFTDSPVTLTTGRDVVFPDQFPAKLVRNNTAQTLTLKKAGETGVTLASGADAYIASGVSDVLKLTAGSGSDRSAVTAVSSSSGVVTLNYALGDYFTLTLTENVTSWAISNPPGSGRGFTLMVQITQGSGPYTVADPGTFAEGGSIDVPTTNGDVGVVAITSFDNGSTLRCSSAKDFA